MGKNFKVAVLRARHVPGTALIDDNACLAAIFHNASRTAVFQYWTDVSEGFITFDGSQLLPWVDIRIDASTDEGRGRNNVWEKARAATVAAGHSLDGFDAALVIAHPGVVTLRTRSGSESKNLDYGETEPDGFHVAVLRATANVHTDFCHELGHAIEWNHTFGLLNNGSDWDKKPPFDVGPEYGDPYDVMSSATFGSRWLDPAGPQYSGNPEFVPNPVPASGWPGDSIWQGLGPMPAQAHMHLYAPQSLEDAGRVKHVDMPATGRSVRQPLFAASRLDHGIPTLLAVHVPGERADGNGRYYVEYRDVKGWDAGLDTAGTDLARRAVVVHRLRDASGALACWYEGRIVVPVELDGDVEVTAPDLPMVVRVAEVAADASFVTVEVSRTIDRSVFVARTDKERIVSFTTQRTDTVNTVCGPISANWGVRRVTTTSVFRASAFGYGGKGTPVSLPPKAAWTVAGQAVAASGPVVVTVAPGRRVTMDATIDDPGGLLTIVNRPDDGDYDVLVGVTVSDSRGRSPSTSAPVHYSADGMRAGYDQSVQQQVRRCIEDVLNKARIRPNEIFVPPVDQRTIRDIEQVERGRLGLVVRTLQRSNPKLAADLQQLVMLRFGGATR